jgi:hypothetical protein
MPARVSAGFALFAGFYGKVPIGIAITCEVSAIVALFTGFSGAVSLLQSRLNLHHHLFEQNNERIRRLKRALPDKVRGIS